eukprot:502472-Rhodomonas_salina.3
MGTLGWDLVWVGEESAQKVLRNGPTTAFFAVTVMLQGIGGFQVSPSSLVFINPSSRASFTAQPLAAIVDSQAACTTGMAVDVDARSAPPHHRDANASLSLTASVWPEDLRVV